MRSDRWQTGDCGVYATALIQARPELRLGATVDDHDELANGHALHYFAHDDRYAYDSRGRHELPYLSVWDSALYHYTDDRTAAEWGLRNVLDVSREQFGPLLDADVAALPAARRHIRRHKILELTV